MARKYSKEEIKRILGVDIENYEHLLEGEETKGKAFVFAGAIDKLKNKFFSKQNEKENEEQVTITTNKKKWHKWANVLGLAATATAGYAIGVNHNDDQVAVHTSNLENENELTELSKYQNTRDALYERYDSVMMNIYNDSKNVYEEYLKSIGASDDEIAQAKGYMIDSEALADFAVFANMNELNESEIAYLLGNEFDGTDVNFDTKTRINSFLETLTEIRDLERAGIDINYSQLLDIHLNSNTTKSANQDLVTVLTSIQTARNGYINALVNNNQQEAEQYKSDLDSIVREDVLNNTNHKFTGIQKTMIAFQLDLTEQMVADRGFDANQVWSDENMRTLLTIAGPHGCKQIDGVANVTVASSVEIRQSDNRTIKSIDNNYYDDAVTQMREETESKINKSREKAKEMSEKFGVENLNGRRVIQQKLEAKQNEYSKNTFMSKTDVTKLINRYKFSSMSLNTYSYNNNNTRTNTISHKANGISNDANVVINNYSDEKIAENAGVTGPIHKNEDGTYTEENTQEGVEKVSETIEWAPGVEQKDEKTIVYNGDEYKIDGSKTTTIEQDQNGNEVKTTTYIKEEQVQPGDEIGKEVVVSETKETTYTTEISNGKETKTYTSDSSEKSLDDAQKEQERIDQEILNNHENFDIVYENTFEDVAKQIKASMIENQNVKTEEISKEETKADDNSKQEVITEEAKQVDTSEEKAQKEETKTEEKSSNTIIKEETVTETKTETDTTIENNGTVSHENSSEIISETEEKYYYTDADGEHILSEEEFNKMINDENFREATAEEIAEFEKNGYVEENKITKIENIQEDNKEETKTITSSENETKNIQETKIENNCETENKGLTLEELEAKQKAANEKRARDIAKQEAEKAQRQAEEEQKKQIEKAEAELEDVKNTKAELEEAKAAIVTQQLNDEELEEQKKVK